ncbi:glycosyltransferase family 2 protein [Clostridium perfringens]|nr:glycosyltransferase family 2 protein [Clostridium perfringens]MDK0793568.1 glycosyltransferase family 2 protein [Clostridium perfringens]
MSSIDVSIIIISWNTEKLLKECLASIYKYTNGIKYEIIIVDNDSSDKTIDMIKNNFSDVVLIESDENLGFGRAHKLALNFIRGEYTLLLNPDTKLKENSIKKMVDYMKCHKDIGLISCKLLNKDKTLQSSFWNFPTIKEAIREFLVNIAKIPLELSDTLERVKEFKIESRNIECVMGAVMMLPSRLFLEMKGFDEDYFMYGEDMDICWIIKKYGLRVFYYSDTEIFHIFGQSSKQINYWREVKTSSALKLFLEKRKGRLYKYIYIFLKVIFNLINCLFYLLVSFNKEYRYKFKSEFIKTICLILNDKTLDKVFKL